MAVIAVSGEGFYSNGGSVLVWEDEEGLAAVALVRTGPVLDGEGLLDIV